MKTRLSTLEAELPRGGEWLLYQQADNGLNRTLIMWSNVGLFMEEFWVQFGSIGQLA